MQTIIYQKNFIIKELILHGKDLHLKQKTDLQKLDLQKMEHKSNFSSKQLFRNFSFIWQSLLKGFNICLEEILTMNAKLEDDLINHAIGSMFGAFIGDSLGSYCEHTFKPIMLNDPQLGLIMQMPGKGTFNIKPGQFTDDSEMVSHMLQALCHYDPKLSLLDQQTNLILKIGEQYVNWYKSNPFSMGNTTRNALSLLNQNLTQMKITIQKGIQVNFSQNLRFILTKIQIKNLQSNSNESLMRITPMAFFISLLLQKQRKQNPKIECTEFSSFIKNEINLTHSNPQIIESSYAWVELLVDIITRKKYKRSLKIIYQNFLDRYANNEVISSWIEESLKLSDMDAIVHLGRAIVCFSYGIKALKTLSEMNEEDLSDDHYITIIKRIISKTGDSDTNAAIVGGLIGAVLGFKKLPEYYLFKQFKLELDENDIECLKRGCFYEPRRQFLNAMRLAQKFENNSS